MISVKLQIDCIIKSNKIVIFLNELHENLDKNVPNAKIIYEKFKSDSFNYGYPQKSTQPSNRNHPYNYLPELDIVKLLEMYGITKKLITIVDINSLKNTKLCEDYLKTAYCNDLNVKYPLVFMHGIFFGSNDEVAFAHEEGFLFELFKDTGFYTLCRMPSSLPYSLANTSRNFDRDNPNQDFEEIINNLENGVFELAPTEEETNSDEECNFAIDKIYSLNTNKLKFKQKVKVKSHSNIETVRTNRKKVFRNISSESIVDYESESSSLASLNKESYCQHYVDCNELKKDYSLDLKNIINFNKNSAENSDDNYASNSNDSMRKITPPGDVLATINTWAKKTKDAIKIRNIQISKKNGNLKNL